MGVTSKSRKGHEQGLGDRWGFAEWVKGERRFRGRKCLMQRPRS